MPATGDTKTLASRFDARPIPGAPFGLEITADLTASFSDSEKEELRRLYRQDGLLLFRNQKLSMEQQIEACSIFGPVLRDSIENYLVSNVEKDGLLGNRELLFHNDVPFVPAPYLGGSLHALEVDDGVSATRFASAFRAWEALPAELQNRIDGLNVLHVRARSFTRRTKLADSEPRDNCAVHALVGRQEETGRPYIFVCQDMAALVAGLSEGDSDALLEELFGYLYAPGNVYEHHWQVGDFIVWDNLGVQHARSEITGGRRTLQRVTIAEFGYWEQVPVDLQTYYDLQEQAD